MVKNHLKNGPSVDSTDPHCPTSSWRENPGNRRLSKQLLHDLRNRIPVQGLITEHLGIRHRMDACLFRFECPVCGAFHTSVKTDKNLARCFECKINFNPIDIVMAVRKTDFHQSADFLASLLASGPDKKPHHRKPGGLCTIKQILVKSNLSGALPEPTNLESRIASLEKQVEQIKYRMDQLHQFLVGTFSKRRDEDLP